MKSASGKLTELRTQWIVGCGWWHVDGGWWILYWQTAIMWAGI